MEPGSVGKFRRRTGNSVNNHLPTTLCRITQTRLKRRSLGWLNSLGGPVDDNKKQRLHGEMVRQVTCAFNQFDANDRVLRGLLKQRLGLRRSRELHGSYY
jgi:hypothetical protein